MTEKVNGLNEPKEKIEFERYDSLDGLRVYAALGIILMHVKANLVVKPSDNYLTQNLIPFFTDFTLLFMMVSAFSMCCGYLKKVKAGGVTPDLFYKRRYRRILPFFAMLCLIDFAMNPSMNTFYQVYADITLCFNFMNTEFSVIGVGWFLGVIFLFYICFPFFVFMIDNRKRAFLSLLIAIGLCFVSKAYIGEIGRTNIIFDAPYFLFGGIVYLYRKEICQLCVKYKHLSIVFLILIIVCYLIIKECGNWYINYIVELLLFTSLLTYAICTKNVILNNGIVRFLSKISMEIYLAHMVMFRAVEKVHLERVIDDGNVLYVVTSALVIVLVICFAYTTKRFIIKPLFP